MTNISSLPEIAAVLKGVSGGLQIVMDIFRKKIGGDVIAEPGAFDEAIREMREIAKHAEEIQAIAMQMKHIMRMVPTRETFDTGSSDE